MIFFLGSLDSTLGARYSSSVISSEVVPDERKPRSKRNGWQHKVDRRKITELEAAGRGSGTGKEYLPWLNRQTFRSIGRCRSTGTSPKSGRVHQFFSDIEYNFFLCLERDKAVIDIREQFPLDRKLTQEVARNLSISHPVYPGSQVPVVMTVDFFVTKVVDGKQRYVGYDTKPASAVEDARTVEKLEIHRETLALMGSTHHLVFDTSLQRDVIDKLEWIRRPNVEFAEVTPFDDYWEETERLFLKEFAGAAPSLTLAQFCKQLDSSMGLTPGTAMTAARQLMFKRILEPDLRARSIQDSTISRFSFTAPEEYFVKRSAP